MDFKVPRIKNLSSEIFQGCLNVNCEHESWEFPAGVPPALTQYLGWIMAL